MIEWEFSISSELESSKQHKQSVEKVEISWIVSVQAHNAHNCTQQVCHGTNKLCTQTLEILINLCVTRSYHVHAFTAQILASWTDCTLTWSYLPSMLYSALYLRLALSCTVDFPPQLLPWIYTFILTIFSYWYYAYLVSFTSICCILAECMLVQNNNIIFG